MMNIVKTAIITIIISIISGLLLEYFKNLAPRILCNIGNCVPMKKDDKRIYAYAITVRNVSKKIIHELAINVQSSKSSLSIGNAKITKGLKFDSSIKNNILDINIPFLSKGDKFTVTVYVENRNKPVIVMRSPENFKRIDSVEEMGFLYSLFNASKNVKQEVPGKTKKDDDFTMIMDKPLDNEKSIGRADRDIIHRKKKLSNNKKAGIAIASVALFIIIGALVKFCLKGTAPSTSAQTSTVRTDDYKQSSDTQQSSKESNKGTDVKPSTNKTNTNTITKPQAGGAAQNKGTNANPSNAGTNENNDSKASAGGTTTDQNATKNQTTTNKDANTKTGTDGSTSNTDTKPSTNGTTAGSGTNTSTTTNPGGTDQNTGK
ncbi:hypothetical protein [Clostridium hydrogenum]|uniref:hypothetical protein n=1 Tax=Clostridium hydrogenum TaxID=2855764 RepID=UPI001F368D07|nr:hypothetical protein [Clostridium hydrogenum]